MFVKYPFILKNLEIIVYLIDGEFLSNLPMFVPTFYVIINPWIWRSE